MKLFGLLPHNQADRWHLAEDLSDPRSWLLVVPELNVFERVDRYV